MATDTGSNRSAKTAGQLAIEAQNARNLAAKQAAPAVPAPAARPSVAAPIRPSAAPAMPAYQPPPQAYIPQVKVEQPMATAAPSAPLLTKTNADPNTQQFLSSLQNRLTTQQAQENAPVTASAERATNLARRDIADAAAGQKKRKEEELAARGLSSGGGVGAGQLRAVDEAARTRGARAAADIGLGRERDQDQLNLARTGMTNSLYGMMGSASQVPWQQQLQGNQQALDTWKAKESADLGRAGLNLQGQTANANIAAQQNQQQQAMWMALMGMR